MTATSKDSAEGGRAWPRTPNRSDASIDGVGPSVRFDRSKDWIGVGKDALGSGRDGESQAG
jgi:hypothetical protein